MSIPIGRGAHRRVGSGSKPISIGATTGDKKLSAKILMAQSAPVVSWQPPPPPAARPRVPSFDPPPLELPQSPPVLSPIQSQTEAAEAEAEAAASASGQAIHHPSAGPAKKQTYSRSLSNYSSSAPTHIDYLAQFGRPAGEPEQGSGSGTSTITSGVSSGSSGFGISSSGVPKQVGPAGIQITGNKRMIPQVKEAMSLGKSPTIFSILQQGIAEDSAEVDDPPPRVRGIVNSSRAKTETRRKEDPVPSADELQFDISLDESEDTEGGDAAGNDSFY